MQTQLLFWGANLKPLLTLQAKHGNCPLTTVALRQLGMLLQVVTTRLPARHLQRPFMGSI